MILNNRSKSRIMNVGLHQKSRDISRMIFFENPLCRGRDVDRHWLFIRHDGGDLPRLRVVPFSEAEIVPVLDPVVFQVPAVSRKADNTV